MAWSNYPRGYGGKSKYKADKVVVDGVKFDSKREARRYRELKLLEKAGEISDLQMQVKFVLIPAQREPDTIGKRGGRGLVDDAPHLEPGDFASVLRRLALGVVEIGRDSNDGFGHLVAEVVLRGALELEKHLGADLRRAEQLAIDIRGFL